MYPLPGREAIQVQEAEATKKAQVAEAMMLDARVLTIALLMPPFGIGTQAQTATDTIAYEQFALNYFDAFIVRSKDVVTGKRYLPRKIHFSGVVEPLQCDENIRSWGCNSPNCPDETTFPAFALQAPHSIVVGLRPSYAPESRIGRLKVFQAIKEKDRVTVWLTCERYFNRLNPHGFSIYRIEMTPAGEFAFSCGSERMVRP